MVGPRENQPHQQADSSMDRAYGPLGVVGALEGELLLEEGGGGALLKGRICPCSLLLSASWLPRVRGLTKAHAPSFSPQVQKSKRDHKLKPLSPCKNYYIHTCISVCMCLCMCTHVCLCVRAQILSFHHVCSGDHSGVRSEASTFVNGVISLPLKLPEGDSLWYFTTTTES